MLQNYCQNCFFKNCLLFTCRVREWINLNMHAVENEFTNKGSLELYGVCMPECKVRREYVCDRVGHDHTVLWPNTFNVIVCDMNAVNSLKESIGGVHKVKNELFIHVCCCSGIVSMCNCGVHFCMVFVRFLMTYYTPNNQARWLKCIPGMTASQSFHVPKQSGQSCRALTMSVTKRFDHMYILMYKHEINENI